LSELTARALVRYSVGLGARAIRRPSKRATNAAAWRIWMPLDVDRVWELPWAGRAVTKPGSRVLDVSSPKLLACWLADREGANVVGTDLWEAEIEEWRRLVSAADPTGQRFSRLTLEVADARNLPYEDASFDSAYSVSVIEHVEDEGDSVVMAELERVVKQGGLVALTFPFRQEFAIEYVNHDLYGQRYEGEPIFFYRHYDDATVQSRLLDGRSFEVVEKGLWRKEGVNNAQTRLHRIVPQRLEVGRLLGPALPVIGARAMSVSEVPGPDNVMHLLLRRV
jgi:ubiquinone/menaquinone biosynthesis C-methylase UbiE